MTPLSCGNERILMIVFFCSRFYLANFIHLSFDHITTVYINITRNEFGWSNNYNFRRRYIKYKLSMAQNEKHDQFRTWYMINFKKSFT